MIKFIVLLYTPHRQARLTGKIVSLVALLVSSGLFTQPGWSHEIRPTVVDLSFADDARYELTISLNLEALIADIGPEHTDTADSANAADYDALRRMPPAALRVEFDTFEARFLRGIRVRNRDGALMGHQVQSVQIEAVGDTDLARTSTVILKSSQPVEGGSIVWAWAPEFGPSIVRVDQAGEAEGYSAYLGPGDASDPIAVTGSKAPGFRAVAANYLWLGFTHILPKGLDHILFVVGLFLLSTRLRPLLLQITSFTLAHTLTLALGVNGVVQLPANIVEPLIAASIVYVCLENIVSDKLQRWRTVVVFGFGLLHGLGFAGVLSEIGISSNDFVTALVSFNIGVELGQIAVIIGCFLLVGVWFRNRSWYRTRITIPASAIIAVIGAYWFVERAWLL